VPTISLAGPGSSTLDLFHTFSDPEQRGKVSPRRLRPKQPSPVSGLQRNPLGRPAPLQGLAGKVVEAALGWCRAHGARAVPTCSYVSHFVAKHPEWQPVTKAPEVRTVAPGGSGAAASSASLPSVGAAEPAPCSHEDHIFGLSYGQYACKVYARGMAATEVTPGLGRLRADADPVLACRMAALCARRATELDDRSSSSAADGARTADSLRLEAAHVLTVLAAEAPDMDWVGPRTAGVVDDLEMRGFLLGFKDRAVGGAGEDGDGGAAKRAKPAGDDAEDE